MSPEQKDSIIKEFWRKWEHDPDILKILDNARIISKHYAAKNASKHIDYDDFYSKGLETACTAIPFWDTDLGEIETYLAIRIRFSMIDLIRKEQAQKGTEKETGSAFTKIGRLERELHEEFNFSNVKHVKALTDLGVSSTTMSNLKTRPEFLFLDSEQKGGKGDGLSSYHDAVGDFSALDPSDYVQQLEFLDQFENALSTLPPREREVFELYSSEHMNLREIGKEMGFSESRSCQLLSRAKEKMAKKLGVDEDFFLHKGTRMIKERKPEEAKELEPSLLEPSL